MDTFSEGDWVTQIKYRGAGRTGRVHAVYSGLKRFCTQPRYVVQFGSDGPYCRLRHSSLTRADPEDVARLMGCRVCDLEGQARVR